MLLYLGFGFDAMVLGGAHPKLLIFPLMIPPPLNSQLSWFGPFILIFLLMQTNARFSTQRWVKLSKMSINFIFVKNLRCPLMLFRHIKSNIIFSPEYKIQHYILSLLYYFFLSHLVSSFLPTFGWSLFGDKQMRLFMFSQEKPRY